MSPVNYFINLTGKFDICVYEIMSDARICFKRRRGQPCRWLSGTDNWVRAHVGDVIIVWRNTHNNTEPNAIWFPATLTDTDLYIQGIQVHDLYIGGLFSNHYNLKTRDFFHFDGSAYC